MFALSAEPGDVLEVHFHLGKLSTKAFVPTPLPVWTSVSQEEPNPRTKRRAMMHREGFRRRGKQADSMLGRQLDLSGSAPHSFGAAGPPARLTFGDKPQGRLPEGRRQRGTGSG